MPKISAGIQAASNRSRPAIVARIKRNAKHNDSFWDEQTTLWSKIDHAENNSRSWQITGEKIKLGQHARLGNRKKKASPRISPDSRRLVAKPSGGEETICSRSLSRTRFQSNNMLYSPSSG